MTLQSDLTIDASKFRPEAASDQIQKFNEYLMDTMNKGPKWFEVAFYTLCPKVCLSIFNPSLKVGAPKYRERQAKGEGVFPPTAVLERGQTFSIPSRENGRDIPCRVMMPEKGVEAKAVYMHMHGSGFVLSSEKE